MSAPTRTPNGTGSLPAAREAVRDLVAPMPVPAACAIDLSDNTNLFGAAPAALRALRDSHEPALARYPSPRGDALREALAAHHGVPVECIITGCGSDGVLDAAIRAFGAPGERLVHHDPTFSMIPVFARLGGLEPAAVPCAGALDADTVSTMFRASPRIVYLCSPNNPTGARLTAAGIAAARERLRSHGTHEPPLVILDQAYAEFDETDERPSRPFDVTEPVLVTRTLSKAFGLAGLRVGYGVAPPEIVAEIEKVRGPYAVGNLAERAAVAALEHDLGWVRATVARMAECRERFVKELHALGLAPLASTANFVLVPVDAAAATAAALADAGVAVRPFTALAGIGDALRVTIGPWPLLAACLAALPEALR